MYLLDVSKLIVVLIALFYLNLRARLYMNRENYWIANLGLVLLLAASILDFADGIPALSSIPILGSRDDPLHDLLEDQVFDTSGLALFALGVFRQIVKGK